MQLMTFLHIMFFLTDSLDMLVHCIWLCL